MNISSFEQDVLYTHWTYYAIPFCKYNIVLIVARAQYNICICLEHRSVFMHQPPPAFPFEFPAISMKAIIASQTAAVKAAKQAQALQTAIAVNACSLPEKSMFASGSKNSKQPVILFAMVCLIINHLSATNPAATLQARIVITAAITQITQLSNCSFGRTLAAYDAAKHKSDMLSSIAPLSLSVCNLRAIMSSIISDNPQYAYTMQNGTVPYLIGNNATYTAIRVKVTIFAALSCSTLFLHFIPRSVHGLK